MRRREFLKGSVRAVVGAAACETARLRLSAEDKPNSRAAAIHRDATVIVIHDHNPVLPDVDRMRAGGVTAKVFQILVDVDIGRDYRKSALVYEGWEKKGLDAIEQVRRDIASQPDQLILALKADDFLRAKREGKIAILLGVEGAKLLEGRIENLKEFYDLGLRELQLRWAYPNQVVEQQALTGFGIEVVRECQRLGVIVDLTHIPDAAFFQTIDLMEKPLIVSHGSAARVRTDLDDRRLKALASRRGVVGVHFYSSYLGPKPTVEQVIANIDAITQVAGIDTVGLGVDFFPTQGPWAEFQRSQSTVEVEWAVEHIGKMEEVTSALVARNYPEADIRKILGGNFLRVCREVFGG